MLWFAPMKPDILVDQVFAGLDRWVYARGKDGYVDPASTPAGNAGLEHGIQQVRSEIREFALRVLESGLRGTVLEIGLGNFGGTHILWREVFARVITLDISAALLERFRAREALDARSVLVCGDSRDAATVRKVADLAGAVDLLFIDGDHSYEAVRDDWRNYHSLVRPGGLVAFHDASGKRQPPTNGASLFLAELAQGKVDGRRHDVHFILHSLMQGIGYMKT